MTVSELAENSGGEEQQDGGGCRGAGEERYTSQCAAHQTSV